MEIIGVLVYKWEDGVKVMDDSLTKVWGVGSDRNERIQVAETYFCKLLEGCQLSPERINILMDEGQYYSPARGESYFFVNCKLQDLTS